MKHEKQEKLKVSSNFYAWIWSKELHDAHHLLMVIGWLFISV